MIHYILSLVSTTLLYWELFAYVYIGTGNSGRCQIDIRACVD